VATNVADKMMRFKVPPSFNSCTTKQLSYLTISYAFEEAKAPSNRAFLSEPPDMVPLTWSGARGYGVDSLSFREAPFSEVDE
jgi:hypothetical protein